MSEIGSEIFKSAVEQKGINKGRIKNSLVAQEEANSILELIGRATSEGYKIDKKARQELNKHKGDYVLTAQAAKTEEYRSKLETDPLTNLLNKKGIDRRLEEALDKHERQGTRYELIFLDLDEFKHFNDTNGHLAGNDLLIKLAKFSETQIRKYDVLGRFGGDEFVLILESPGIKSTERITNRMRNFFTRLAKNDSRYRGLAVSLGSYVIEPGEQIDARTIYERADAALYTAKQTKGTHLTRWIPGMVNPKSKFIQS